MTTISKNIGDSGELLASQYLTEKSYIIRETNYHSKYGEIDLIAQDADTLVFVEVKNYSKSNYISLYNAISKHKQQKIIRTAKKYLLDKQIADMPSRFDVVLFEEGHFIEHIEGAFFI
ncbi:MAG: YraN family protein [Candidatus Margulisbacteria bacterium GWF2_35_9]|nr:MAG: YraN family protein [Candidatus Margulisbacteria bacterium GWF2_35_9]